MSKPEPLGQTDQTWNAIRANLPSWALRWPSPQGAQGAKCRLITSMSDHLLWRGNEPVVLAYYDHLLAPGATHSVYLCTSILGAIAALKHTTREELSEEFFRQFLTQIRWDLTEERLKGLPDLTRFYESLVGDAIELGRRDLQPLCENIRRVHSLLRFSEAIEKRRVCQSFSDEVEWAVVQARKAVDATTLPMGQTPDVRRRAGDLVEALLKRVESLPQVCLDAVDQLQRLNPYDVLR